jgi:hypothetical protein
MASAAPFGSLMSSAFTFFQMYKKPIFSGAVLFTVLVTMPQIFMQKWGSPQNISTATSTELTAVAVGLCVWIVISFLNYAYYLSVFIDQQKDMTSGIRGAGRLVWRLIGMSVVVFLRTYSWIILLSVPLFIMGRAYTPLAFLVIVFGIACAIIRGPRFFLAPILIAGGDANVRHAVSESYAKTKGYWGKIVGNVILISLFCMILIIIVSMILGMLVGIAGVSLNMKANTSVAMTLSVVTMLLYGYISQLYQAYISAFHVKLAATIIASPRGTISA